MNSHVSAFRYMLKIIDHSVIQGHNELRNVYRFILQELLCDSELSRLFHQSEAYKDLIPLLYLA